MVTCYLAKYNTFFLQIQRSVLSLTANSRNFCTKSQEFVFKEKTVQIRTCDRLYKQWKKEKLFSKVPESGLNFNVPYIDTAFDAFNSSCKKVSHTVLTLHGAPGSWRDYVNQISYLHRLGYRVIAPSFPDFHVYKPGVFRHSDVEKAEYIRDFLKALCVTNIDLLICHSGSVYPGLNLCFNSDQLKIKSLALLNPVTFNFKEMSFTKSFPFIKTFVKLCENPVPLKIIEKIGPFILKNFFTVPVKFESILDPLMSATTLAYGHIHESKEKFQKVVQKLPVLYIFSENDPLIGAKCGYELAELLGAHSSDIFTYDKNGVLIQQGKTTQMLKVLVFQEGSHYVIFKHPEIINKEIEDFLKLQEKISLNDSM